MIERHVCTANDNQLNDDLKKNCPRTSVVGLFGCGPNDIRVIDLWLDGTFSRTFGSIDIKLNLFREKPGDTAAPNRALRFDLNGRAHAPTTLGSSEIIQPSELREVPATVRAFKRCNLNSTLRGWHAALLFCRVIFRCSRSVSGSDRKSFVRHNRLFCNLPPLQLSRLAGILGSIVTSDVFCRGRLLEVYAREQSSSGGVESRLARSA